MQPPGSASFRTLNVYPNQEEILKAGSPFRENITKGKYNSIEHYLDIQFRLLREDFIACVREGIHSYRNQKPTKNLDVYDNVRIFKHKDNKGTEVCKIKIPPLDKDSKKFMNGSLLLFTKNNFDSFVLAKVLYRNTEKLEAAIDTVDSNNNVLVGQNFIRMAECCAYFDPYFNVLNALKSMSGREFPMEKYIIEVDTLSVYLPRYLLNCTKYKIGNYALPPEMIPKFQENQNLNEAQFKAFKAALSQEFVVIQGPPGTGKTFLGLKIVETLLQNCTLWHRDTPLLVVSHKNHALDQFLEGLLPITSRLVRVGGQSKSDKLKPFNLDSEIVKPANKFAVYLKKMQKALVVGMTTSIAARWKSYLEQLKCPIVIVEEAAEVLESHVVASLTKHCQHLILLGDHKQLQPITGDYTVGSKYGLGVSLFERMVRNGIQWYQLNVQHRMRPEIADLLRSKIYPFLVDHESTLARPSIAGISKNVFFLDHQQKEETSNIVSKKNAHEAKFLVALAKHLVFSGYKAENLVILATYSGQVEELEKFAGNQIKGVKISTLDAFQGQEADIVLFSLVRSEEIGFLARQNRICVGLSRAKNGFYIIGNMELLAKKSNIWYKVKKCLRKQRSLGDALPLKCPNHPDAVTHVRCAEDFPPNGDCGRICGKKLQCGHFCELKCHNVGRTHDCGNCWPKNLRSMLPRRIYEEQPRQGSFFIGLVMFILYSFYTSIYQLIAFILSPFLNRK